MHEPETSLAAPFPNPFAKVFVVSLALFEKFAKIVPTQWSCQWLWDNKGFIIWCSGNVTL